MLSRRVIVFLSILWLVSCAPSVDDVRSLYEKTYQTYQARYEKNPQSSKIRRDFARFCYAFRDYQKIEEILENPAGSDEQLLLAKALARGNQFTRAMEVFSQIKDDITDPEGLFLYANVLEEKNLYPQAMKVYAKVGPPYALRAKERREAIKVSIETEIPEYIGELKEGAAPFLEKVSNEAAIILSIQEETEITSSHTAISTVHVVEMVLKERGKRLAEVQIGYDSTYERVELESARTITSEGNIVYVGEENIRDVSKYLNYPLYSNARARIISMPSVDVGAIIEYKVKIFSAKLMNDKDFSFLYRLRENHPIYKAGFRLTIPEDRDARVKFFNIEHAQGIDVDPVVTVKENKKTYAWNFSNVMPIVPEEHMPPLSFVNPAMLISSFESWEDIYRWWYALYRDKLGVSPEIEQVVVSLTSGVKDPRRKAKAIANYVARNIRYVAVEYGESGHEPHHAREVFLNRYGDCKDQAILLVAMLKEAGLDARPVLIPTEDVYPIEEKFPSVNFNHAIAAVRLGNTFVFMDPTAETTSFEDLPIADQDRTVMIFSDQGYTISRTPQLTNSRISYDMDIALDNQENAEIRRTVTTEGAYTSYHRWYLKYTHPDTIREDIESKMVKISPFSELIEYHIDNVDNFDASPELSYTFRTEKFLNPAKTMRVVPVLNEIDLKSSIIAKKERIFPVDLLGLFTKEAQVTIALPGNLRIKHLPQNTTLRTKWFDFFLTYARARNSLDFSQKFVIKKRFVSEKEYREFRRQLKEVFYLLKEEIILEKVKG